MEFTPLQKPNEIIDVSNWNNLKVYEEGSKPKKEVFSPIEVRNEFLNPNYRYLLKYSTNIHGKAHKEQFWVEVFAYYFGELIGVEVPKTFVAVDEKGKNGSLSEWFYWDKKLIKSAFLLSKEKKLRYKNINIVEEYVSGYNFMVAKIDDYDIAKGRQHNLNTIFEIMKEERLEKWIDRWIEIFTFDTLIGDTDRHQDNWGILYAKNKKILSPAFDNGTSMGYEIIDRNFFKFDDENYIKNYIKKGYHHIKLSIDEEKQVKHLDLIKELLKRNNKIARRIISRLLDFKKKDVEDILDYLVLFKVENPLTEKRAEFMLKLLLKRKELIALELKK